MSDAKRALLISASHLFDAQNFMDKAEKSNEAEPSIGKALSSLSLSNKHLATARRIDPNASADAESPKEGPISFSVNQLQAELHHFEGECYMILEKAKKANESFEKALKISPDHAYVLAAQARALVHLGQRDESIRKAKKASALEPDNIAFAKLIDELEMSSRLGVAIGSFAGSWKLLGFLIVLGIFITALGLMLIAGGEDDGYTQLVFALALFGGSFLYWKNRRG
jgi:tetratricopeptide (TPR) repeat protein